MKKFICALTASFASIIAHADVKWKVAALTPEYILVQADGADDESAAFFADPRQAELEGAKMADWQLARDRKSVV